MERGAMRGEGGKRRRGSESKLGVIGFTLAVTLFAAATISCLTESRQKPESAGASHYDDKVDSVIAHYFEILDARIGLQAGEEFISYDLDAAMRFMARVTGIESEAGAATFGRYYVEPVDVERWKAWIKENRNLLRWDPAGDSVVVVALGGQK